MLMSLAQISAAAGALGNQSAAGIPLVQAVARMGRLQPQYAEFWQRAADVLRAGSSLSSVIDEVWPEQLVAVVRSGEESGSIAEVFQKIEQTVELQLQLRAKMMKLGYPVAMGLAGVLIFIGFMIFVLPALGDSMGRGDPSLIFQVSKVVSVFVKAHWIALLAGVAMVVVAILTWAKTDQARELVVSILLQVPVINMALRDMYFGLWGQYLAMMVGSGITTVDSLKSTAAILPSGMADSVAAFTADLEVNNKGLADSADLERIDPSDPRATWWPFYISNAFIVAEQTGDVAKELHRACPILVKEGVKTLERFISVLNGVALAFSAVLIVTPMAAYYIEIFASIGNSR